MSEVIRKRLTESFGKPVIIFLKNDFRFDGVVTGFDEKFVEMVLDNHRGYKIISTEEIKEINIKENKDG